MSNIISQRKTTFQRLKPGMSVFWDEKILKIIKLKDIKITENGLIYRFDVDGGNGILMGASSKKITIIK
ncbi:MAG TPA: hypothetical protein ACHBX0_09145 [Arsenophonus sp.]